MNFKLNKLNIATFRDQAAAREAQRLDQPQTMMSTGPYGEDTRKQDGFQVWLEPDLLVGPGSMDGNAQQDTSRVAWIQPAAPVEVGLWIDLAVTFMETRRDGTIERMEQTTRRLLKMLKEAEMGASAYKMLRRMIMDGQQGLVRSVAHYLVASTKAAEAEVKMAHNPNAEMWSANGPQPAGLIYSHNQEWAEASQRNAVLATGLIQGAYLLIARHKNWLVADDRPLYQDWQEVALTYEIRRLRKAGLGNEALKAWREATVIALAGQEAEAPKAEAPKAGETKAEAPKETKKVHIPRREWGVMDNEGRTISWHITRDEAEAALLQVIEGGSLHILKETIYSEEEAEWLVATDPKAELTEALALTIYRDRK